MSNLFNSKLQIKLLEGVRSPQDFEEFRMNLLKSNKYKLEKFLDTHIEEERGRLTRRLETRGPHHEVERRECVQWTRAEPEEGG
jgi:hypothetical protein